MGFLNLNLYEHPSGAAFDPDAVIRKVGAHFPEATVAPGDQLALRAQHAESVAPQLSPEGASTVVETLRRNARSYGPACAFTIPLPEGDFVRGLARSVNVQFLFNDPLPEEMRERLVTFLKSLGVGRLEASTNDARQSEVLCDLWRESDCLSDKPGVPWNKD